MAKHRNLATALRTVAGEGRTARRALEALAFSLRDDEVDEALDGLINVRIKRAEVRKLGSEETFDGFIAEIVR